MEPKVEPEPKVTEWSPIDTRDDIFKLFRKMPNSRGGWVNGYWSATAARFLCVYFVWTLKRPVSWSTQFTLEGALPVNLQWADCMRSCGPRDQPSRSDKQIGGRMEGPVFSKQIDCGEPRVGFPLPATNRRVKSRPHSQPKYLAMFG